MHNNTGDDTLDTLLHAISGVLTLILMGLIGCVLAELGWINDTNKSILPKLINYVSLPLFFVYNITHTFSHDQLLHLIKGSIVPFISIAICFILSVIAAHFMAPKGRRGIFQSSFTKCGRKAPKFIYGDISSLKNNDSISLFFIVLYF